MSELEKVRNDVYSCNRCGVCMNKTNPWGHWRGVCPVREHTSGFEPTFARGRVGVARAILAGELDYSPELAQVVYECLLCGNCRAACGMKNLENFKPRVDNPKIMKALRADLFAAGVQVPEGVKMFGDNVERAHNVYAAPSEERADWLTPDIKVAQKADTIYFTGCQSAYRHPEIAQATARILNKADVPFSILGEEEWCCGDPLVMTGQLVLAKEVARHNYELLKGKKVITSCAGCYRCFMEEYPKLLGEEYEELNVVHTVQLLAELVDAGKLPFKAHEGKKVKVTYHDPCEIGRDMELFDEPRNVIGAIPGIELVEMYRNRENAWCCGGGGGIKGANYALSLEIAKDKIPEALATGAKVLVSACPECKASMKDAAIACGADLRVIDITELVAEALGTSRKMETASGIKTPQKKEEGTALTIKSSLADIAADPRGKAILDKHLAGMTASPKFEMIKGGNLKDIAKMSGGKITPEMVKAVEEDLSGIKTPQKKEEGTALTIKSSLADIAADPRGKAILDKHLAGMTASPKFEMIKGGNLKDIAKMSGGKITLEMVKAVEEDLNKL